MGGFDDLLGGLGGGKSAKGKKAYKYNKAWIVIDHVSGGLYTALEAGTAPPTPVVAIRLEDKDFIRE